MSRKCPSCQSENLEPGEIQSTGKIYFKPANTKFLTLKTSNVQVKANICLDCGNIMLIGDIEKTKDLTSRAKSV